MSRYLSYLLHLLKNWYSQGTFFEVKQMNPWDLCVNLNFIIWKAFLPLSYKLALEDQLHNFQDPVRNEYWELLFKLRILRWWWEGIKPSVGPCWADNQSGPVSSYSVFGSSVHLVNSQEKSNTMKVRGSTFQPWFDERHFVIILKLRKRANKIFRMFEMGKAFTLYNVNM